MHSIHRAPLLSVLPAALLLAAILLAGCRKDDTPQAIPITANRVIAYNPGTLVIQGTYTDNFGGAHTISPTQWVTDFGTTPIRSFDNPQRTLIGFLGNFEDTFGGTPLQDNYSRFDWALYKGATDTAPVLYYCQSYPYVASELAASALPRADDGTPDTSGCGGFSWTRLGAPAWPYFFHPELALGPPGGTLDVASLGYDPAAVAPTLGGSLTLGLGSAGDPAQRACIEDGPGADFSVLENGFRTQDATDGDGTDSEVALVEVSADAVTWFAFPVTIDGAKPLVDPSRYHGLAGVLPGVEGGDPFDLADVIAAYPGTLVGGFIACYVRLTDGGTLYPDYGNTQSDLYASGADIDAVVVTHALAAPALTP